MTRPVWPLAGAGLVLLALSVAEMLCHVAGSVATIGSDQRLELFAGFECVAGLVYFAAVWLIRARPAPRQALTIVLVLAALMRAAPLVQPPFLSSDLFRYVWDGRVQAAGINPYLYKPAAPELQFLRDPEIYENINRAEEARTIYPPVAQVIFAAIGVTWSSTMTVKLVMAGFEALAIACVVLLLRRAGLPPAGVLVYAWNPLPLWEYAGNGHIDAAAIGFMAVALLAAASGRRQGLAGILLGAAILCKLLPAAIFPAFWRRWDWRFALGCGATIIVLYAAYAWDAGKYVIGYLPGYASEEGLDAGSGEIVLRVMSWLTPITHTLAQAYLAVAGLILLGLAAYVMRKPLPVAEGPRILAIGSACAVLACATTVVISPHYPWYFGWLALFACFAPYRSVIYLSASAVLTVLDPFHRADIYPAFIYGPCLVLAVIDVLQPVRRLAPAQP